MKVRVNIGKISGAGASSLNRAKLAREIERRLAESNSQRRQSSLPADQAAAKIRPMLDTTPE